MGLDLVFTINPMPTDNSYPMNHIGKQGYCFVFGMQNTIALAFTLTG